MPDHPRLSVCAKCVPIPLISPCTCILSLLFFSWGPVVFHVHCLRLLCFCCNRSFSLGAFPYRIENDKMTVRMQTDDLKAAYDHLFTEKVLSGVSSSSSMGEKKDQRHKKRHCSCVFWLISVVYCICFHAWTRIWSASRCWSVVPFVPLGLGWESQQGFASSIWRTEQTFSWRKPSTGRYG